ncbi:Nucleoside phosphorylase [Ruminococcaceae bacterium KH2T8]|nr:Nucleoside phosphorylase [Ruminococcaceae bacterium KH2T8]
MICFFFAMRCEAIPFIRLLGLKRDSSFGGFEVYRGEDITLCVTGMGKVDAACAVSAVLSSVLDIEHTLVVNIGVCAGRKAGEIYRISRLHDEDSGKDQYPDMLLKTDYPEICLHTSDAFKLDDNFTDDMSEFVYDMEGAAVFRAASSYVSPDRILLFKVVSDSGSPEGVTEELCIDLIGRYSEKLIGEINEIYASLPSSGVYDEANKIFVKYSDLYHCTEYMNNTLNRLIRFALSEGVDIDYMLAGYLPIENKKAANEALSDVERRLILS